jgi:hypothetical protein
MAGSASIGPKVQNIWVAYDQPKDGVTVNPDQVEKGTTVQFLDPNKGKLRIVFLSPTGKESETVSDSQVAVMAIGGVYHFKCFFTPVGATHEKSPTNGGVIVVSPERP